MLIAANLNKAEQTNKGKGYIRQKKGIADEKAKEIVLDALRWPGQ